MTFVTKNSQEFASERPFLGRLRTFPVKALVCDRKRATGSRAWQRQPPVPITSGDI
jgi:hypothetical protein